MKANVLLITIILIILFCIYILSFKSIFCKDCVSESFTLSTREDDLYAKLHSTVFTDDDFYDFDTDQIIKRIVNKDNLLDAGCGVGNHYKRLSKTISVLGVDNNRTLLKQARIRNPEGKFVEADLGRDDLFKKDKFENILCGVDTIHHNDDKKIMSIVSNFYQWLKPGGLFFIHLFKKESLDPAPRSFSQYYHDKDGNKHSLTYFDDFSHDSWWEATKSDDVYIYREKFITEKEKSKESANVFYIPEQSKIIKKIQLAGFKLVDIVDMKPASIESFDLYMFKKPMGKN